MTEQLRTIRFKKIRLLAASNSGATLIELLISMAILSVISVVFLNIITGSISLRSDSDLTKQASAIATSKIEAIKAADTLPVDLIQTESVSGGYTVRTEYTETTNALDLTKVSLPQKDTSSYNNTPAFEITLNDGLTGHYGNTQITGLDFNELTNYKFTLNIVRVDNTVDLLSYNLSYNTNTGVKEIKIGSQTLSKTDYKPAKIMVGANLKQNIELNVVDNVGEHLQIGIFDDNLSRIQTQISGINAAVRIENGLLTQAADSQLKIHYYDVVVSVTKNGREYARVLTTWAVGQ